SVRRAAALLELARQVASQPEDEKLEYVADGDGVRLLGRNPPDLRPAVTIAHHQQDDALDQLTIGVGGDDGLRRTSQEHWQHCLALSFRAGWLLGLEHDDDRRKTVPRRLQAFETAVDKSGDLLGALSQVAQSLAINRRGA